VTHICAVGGAIEEASLARHELGTREQCLATRVEVLAAEKELTRRGDELARRRRGSSCSPRRRS
jgi:predicted dithiol-disulfide oxidoreductase (DUF899 family)